MANDNIKHLPPVEATRLGVPRHRAPHSRRGLPNHLREVADLLGDAEETGLIVCPRSGGEEVIAHLGSIPRGSSVAHEGGAHCTKAGRIEVLADVGVAAVMEGAGGGQGVGKGLCRGLQASVPNKGWRAVLGSVEVVAA